MLPSDDPSGSKSTYGKWGRICPVELWDGYGPSAPITVPAFFQVLFPRMLLYTPVRGTERTRGSMLSPPFFWSVFIGSLVQRMRKMIFLAWFWPVTPQLPCPFSICESCDERDHWAYYQIYNIRAGFLDKPVLEGFIHSKRAICAKNGDLPFLWSVNHYANVYLHQRKTVKRDIADGKIDSFWLLNCDISWFIWRCSTNIWICLKYILYSRFNIYISIYVEVIADIYCSFMYIGHLSKL